MLQNQARLAAFRHLLFIAFSLLTAQAVAGQAIDVPMTAESWTISYNETTRIKDHPEPRFEQHLGAASLYLPHGIATVNGVELQDGTIEADIATHERGLFLGLAFRVRDPANYELIYFRPSSSGTTEAVRYTPGLNGAIVWQLLSGPDATAAAEIPRDQWLHVRAEIAGTTATLYLGGQAKPALVVPHLKRGDSRGGIGFWGLFRGGYVSHFRYTARPDRPPLPEQAAPVKGGFLGDWQISDAFDVAEKNPGAYPRNLEHWESVPLEPEGYVLLNRYRTSPEIMPTPPREVMLGRVPGSRVVFARTLIESAQARDMELVIAYSDEVVVYLNGRPLFSGKNAWLFREPNALGLFAWNDKIVLPLKKGHNELMLAVTEFMGGWAFGCKTENDLGSHH